MFAFWITILIALILYVVVIYFINRFWKRLIKARDNRQFATFLSSLLFAPVIYFVWFNIWLFSVTYYPQKDFNQTKWTNDIEGRYEMTKDIIDSQILLGKTKLETEALLGKNGLQKSKGSWIYDVGFVPGLFNIDPDILVIEFKNDLVIKVYQRGT